MRTPRRAQRREQQAERSKGGPAARESAAAPTGDHLIFRKRLPSPDDVADALRRLSRIATLRGDAPAAAALAAAARHSATLDPKALKAALDEPARAFDPAIASHIAAIAREGPAAAATAAEGRLPRDVAGIARAPASISTPLAAAAGVHVAADLAAAWHERPMGDVAALLAEMRSGQSRLLLGRALGAVDLLVDAMRRAQPSLTLYPAGALRRFEPTVGDLLVLAAGGDPRAAVAAWADSLPAGRRPAGAAATPSRSSGTARRSPCAPWPTPGSAPRWCTTPARASTWRSSPSAPACAACG